MGWAKKRGLIREVPVTETIPVRRKDIELPTPQQAALIISKLPANVAFLVRFLFETGARKGEALNLKWEDIDEINGVS